MKALHKEGLEFSPSDSMTSKIRNYSLQNNVNLRIRIEAVFLCIMIILASLPVILTSNQNIPPQVLRYIDVNMETVEEIMRIGDPNNPQLIIYKVNPSGDNLIYDVIQQDILGGIYWRADCWEDLSNKDLCYKLYLRDKLSQYLYEKNKWYQNYVNPIITKHESSVLIISELRGIGDDLAKEYAGRKLAAWSAGAITALIVVTLITGGVGGSVIIAMNIFSNALNIILNTVNILNEYKFAYANYPAATLSMAFIVGTQAHSKEEIDKIINNLFEHDEEAGKILNEILNEEIRSLIKSAPSLFVETLASYISTLKYVRTINPHIVDKILADRGLYWDTVKDFATNDFYKILKALSGEKTANNFKDIIVRFDKPEDFEKYYQLKDAPIRGLIGTIMSAVAGWASERFVEWWLKVDDERHSMLNVIGHAEPLMSINQYVLSSADNWHRGRFCSSEISSDTISCIPPSISTVSSLMLYDQLYENNWVEFWNITYTNDKIADTLSRKQSFKNWIEKNFNKKINDKESLKTFAKERVEYHMEKLISLMTNLTKISMELEDELKNYVKVLEKRIPIAVQREQKGNNIVLVLDRSGSMNQILVNGISKIDLAKDASSKFVNMLFENDKISLVTFSDNARLEVELTNDHAKVIDSINSIIVGGSTALGDAMRLALNILKDKASERRVIILLTDGCHNAGNETPEIVLKDAKEMKIPIFTIGIGTGMVRDPSSNECFDPDRLEKISKETGATFYWINPNVGVDELELWRVYGRIAIGMADVKPVNIFSDKIMPKDIKSHVFEVTDNVERLNVMLSYKGSKLSLELITPDGDMINGSGPNVIFIESIGRVFVTVSSPQPGRWEAIVIGVDVPQSGEPYILSFGLNALSISPRELLMTASQLGGEITLVIRNDGEIAASNVSVHVDGPLRGYIHVNPTRFSIEKGENITLTIKVDKPDNYAKRFGKIILDNNGWRYVIPVNVILNGLIINAWTDGEIYAGEKITLNVAVFDESYSPVTAVNVTVKVNGEIITLKDDGLLPDIIANDGIYAGYFTPSRALTTLNIRAEKDTYLPAFMSLSYRAKLRGDINEDGVVDYRDLTMLAAVYGKSKGDPGFDIKADLNNDDIINYIDLAILAANYGGILS
jgi:Mg-chelatase subunit ChlD